MDDRFVLCTYIYIYDIFFFFRYDISICIHIRSIPCCQKLNLKKKQVVIQMYQIPSQTASIFPLFLHLGQKDMVPEYRDTRFVARRVDRHLPSDWLQYHNFDNFGCNFGVLLLVSWVGVLLYPQSKYITWGLFWLVTFGIFWLYLVLYFGLRIAG